MQSSHADSASAASGGSGKLFVGQVPAVCTEEMLLPLFQPYGNILEVKVMRDQQGRSKGCAWVRFETQAMASQAISALHEKHTIPPQTNPLRVQFALPGKVVPSATPIRVMTQQLPTALAQPTSFNATMPCAYSGNVISYYPQIGQGFISQQMLSATVPQVPVFAQQPSAVPAQVASFAQPQQYQAIPNQFPHYGVYQTDPTHTVNQFAQPPLVDVSASFVATNFAPNPQAFQQKVNYVVTNVQSQQPRTF